MNMNINKYRKVLHKRLILLIISFICMWIGCAIFFLNISLYELSEFARGLMPGLVAGLSFTLIRISIKIVMALKNGAKLQKMFIKENDERTKHILYKTSRFAIICMMILLYIGMVVAGFFDMTVFWTLYVVIFVLIGVMVIGKIYFNITD